MIGAEEKSKPDDSGASTSDQSSPIVKPIPGGETELITETEEASLINFDSSESEILSESENISNNSNFVENMGDQKRTDFLRTANQTINHVYSGDPTSIDAFLDSVELLKIIAGQEHSQLLFQFLKTRLAGDAREAISASDDTIEKIIASLRRKIKPDNSKIIQGRLTALRLDRKTKDEFSKQLEQLSEAYRRSLVVEGYPEGKAKELTIEKTIEVCRASTRADIVKSILAASKFEDPKEVIAKFIVETDANVSEKQVMAYQTFRAKNAKYGNGNQGNFRGKNGGKRYSNNFQNGYNGNRGGGNGRNNYTGNRNNYYNGNYGNNNNSGNRGGGNGRGGRGGYHNGNRHVRVLENFQAPQSTLGENEQSNNL